MKEAEFTSELLVSMLEGIQDLTTLDHFYNKYDESFDNRQVIEERFCGIIDTIGNILDGSIQRTKYSSSALFYSLFVVIHHMQYGTPNADYERVSFSEKDYAKIRAALADIESIFDKEFIATEEQRFITACKKSTTHKINKEIRCDFIAKYLLSYLK
jgi:hypothetical protein